MVLITLSKGNNTIKTVAKCKREMAPKEEVLNVGPEAAAADEEMRYSDAAVYSVSQGLGKKECSKSLHSAACLQCLLSIAMMSIAMSHA